MQKIKEALSQIKHPLQDADIMSSQCVQNIEFAQGEVHLTLHFSQPIARDQRHALEDEIYDTLVQLEDVDDVEMEIEVPQEASTPASSTPKHEPGLSVHTPNAKSESTSNTSQQNAGSSQEQTEHVGAKQIKHLIAIGSGKGGVGKSTIAANLALSLQAQGARVGLCDIDMYGPSAPIILGVQGAKVKADSTQKKFIPVEAYGMKVMSIGFLIDEETPVIWRGPIVGSIVKQFLDETLWGELDYLIIDLPPGTGDAQLTLTQSIKVTAALMVTTPSELSVADAIKGMQMFRKVDIPILGVVENMSYYVCSECGHESNPFNQGGTERMCTHFGTTVLARIPLDDTTQRSGDEGRPIVAALPESPQSQAFHDLAQQVSEKLPFQANVKKSSFLSSLFKR